MISRMPAHPTSPTNSYLIVITVWQNNLGHEKLSSFQASAQNAMERIDGLLFTDRDGQRLPRLAAEDSAEPRRLASFVVRTDPSESAEKLATRVKEAWIGAKQNGLNRGFDLGNGHEARGNCRTVIRQKTAAEYADAFKVVEGELSAQDQSPAVQSIAKYLQKKLNPTGRTAPAPLTPPQRSSGRPQGRGGSASRGRRSRALA